MPSRPPYAPFISRAAMREAQEGHAQLVEIIDGHLDKADDYLSEALSLMPDHADAHAIDLALAELVDQLGQVRADLAILVL